MRTRHQHLHALVSWNQGRWPSMRLTHHIEQSHPKGGEGVASERSPTTRARSIRALANDASAQNDVHSPCGRYRRGTWFAGWAAPAARGGNSFGWGLRGRILRVEARIRPPCNLWGAYRCDRAIPRSRVAKKRRLTVSKMCRGV